MMNLVTEITQRLQVLEPTTLELTDESHLHAWACWQYGWRTL